MEKKKLSEGKFSFHWSAQICNFSEKHKSSWNSEKHVRFTQVNREFTLKELLWFPKQVSLCDVKSGIVLFYSRLFSKV